MVAPSASPSIRAILGFSRFLQATLSVAQPMLAALVALHSFPPAGQLAIGVASAWAGFLAVFALNDLLDVDLDRDRFAHLRSYDDFDIDSALSRHPLARQQMSHSLALSWVGGLAGLALAGAWLLHPLAAGLFLLAALLEIAYCKLARVTPAKTLISGAMVGVGALAGWVAMSREVRPLEMGLVFLWMAAWEIGGRNIVNDFADVEEDARLGVKTVSLVYGPKVAAGLTLGILGVTVLTSVLLGIVSGLGSIYLAGAALAGGWMLLEPGLRLMQHPTPQQSMALFNRASLYPIPVLVALIASLYLPL